MIRACLLLLLLLATGAVALHAHEIADPTNDTALVYAYVAAHAAATFRNPNGTLHYPYQVPAGPYNELWDWDSVFLGVATSYDFGAAAYFVGSMMNFLSAVNLSTGEVKGCLTPDGDVGGHNAFGRLLA